MRSPDKKPKKMQQQIKNNAQHRALPRPTEIKAYLDQHVVGQERATVSYTHLRAHET